MQWVKAGAVGALGSLAIFVVMIVGIEVTGLLPFNVPPSAAFLIALNIPPQPLGVVAHFAYGIAWAVILFAVFRERTNVWNGLAMAVIVQWLLLMMLIYSPIIGWGGIRHGCGQVGPRRTAGAGIRRDVRRPVAVAARRLRGPQRLADPPVDGRARHGDGGCLTAGRLSRRILPCPETREPRRVAGFSGVCAARAQRFREC